MKRSVGVVAAVFLWIVCPSNVGADTNIGRAKMDIKNIEKAIAVYKIKNYTYPLDLKTLTENDDGEGPLLKDEAIFDPWRRPYHYERNNPHPKTGVPLVWSAGEDPDDPGCKISNWGESVPRRPVPLWRRVYDNLFFYGFLLFTVVAVVMVCATSKYWNERELQGWVAFLLVALAVGWVTYLGWLASTSVMY
jgi:hypothetical protein